MGCVVHIARLPLEQSRLMREFVEDEDYILCCNESDNAAAPPKHLPPISMTQL